jgi:hypothetical protein
MYEAGRGALGAVGLWRSWERGSMILSESELAIREALTRLAESPVERLGYVVIENQLTRRFVQFCTPPPPSPFAGRLEFPGDGPLIFDGTGDGKPGGYAYVQTRCSVHEGVTFALKVLGEYLPDDAEIRIVEGSKSS